MMTVNEFKRGDVIARIDYDNSIWLVVGFGNALYHLVNMENGSNSYRRIEDVEGEYVWTDHLDIDNGFHSIRDFLEMFKESLSKKTIDPH